MICRRLHRLGAATVHRCAGRQPPYLDVFITAVINCRAVGPAKRGNNATAYDGVESLSASSDELFAAGAHTGA
jgi:hypothetical protein